MTRQENWQRVMDEHAAELAAKDRVIAKMQERLDLAAQRIAALTVGTYPLTSHGLPPSEFGQTSGGINRMAASMRLPTTTKSVPPALAVKLPAGILRMASSMKLPVA